MYDFARDWQPMTLAPTIGFVPRTFIGKSHMLITLMQAHLEHIDEGGLLVFIDLEKAFDKCSWEYLHLAIRALRFAPPFTTWTDMLYDESKGTKRQVLANGHLSKPYRVRVGAAQGCPLSPLLFLIIIEGFTRLLNNDKDLIGIKIGSLHKKVNHFADDSIAALRDELMLPRFNQHVDTFCEATSMAENLAKRDILPIGAFKNKPHSSFAGIRQVRSQTKGRLVNPG